MIRAYRMVGHLQADLDPLGITPKTPQATLDPKHYQFEGAALDLPIYVDGILGLTTATPRQLLDKLRGIYCGRIGYEFMHINDAEQKTWLQRRIEGDAVNFTPEGKKAILNKLIEAEGFEKFASNRFVGTKRFGLDGAEATIPGAGADHQARRPAGRQRDRAGHGPSRPPERAGQCDGQALSPAVP